MVLPHVLAVRTPVSPLSFVTLNTATLFSDVTGEENTPPPPLTEITTVVSRMGTPHAASVHPKPSGRVQSGRREEARTAR